jgi:hypothetical protein
LLPEWNHTWRCTGEKILAITLGIRFIRIMVIRVFIGNSKLSPVRQEHASGFRRWRNLEAQLAKGGLPPCLIPPRCSVVLHAATLPVSAPSGSRTVRRMLRSWGGGR